MITNSNNKLNDKFTFQFYIVAVSIAKFKNIFFNLTFILI